MNDCDRTRAQVTQAMAGARAAVQQQLGSGRLAHLDVDASALVRFSAELPATLEPALRAELLARAEALQPWLQGPFLLGGDLVVGGTGRNDQRWQALTEYAADLSGQRVLDVGCNAGYDPFMFHLNGATEVLACEPYEFINQARFLEDVYRTGVRFEPLAWQDLDAREHGTFDLVHCHGVLYHDAHPVAMLGRLRSMLAPGGRLLLGSMMLADPELAEYARFVPNAYNADPTWWWVPGRLALRWMLEAVGLRITAEFGHHDGPAGEFATINGYFEAVLSDPAPDLTSATATA
ncbi:MAG: DUF1698 domain-containing protein [Solirubrobacteraceae bacterium]